MTANDLESAVLDMMNPRVMINGKHSSYRLSEARQWTRGAIDGGHQTSVVITYPDSNDTQVICSERWDRTLRPARVGDIVTRGNGTTRYRMRDAGTDGLIGLDPIDGYTNASVTVRGGAKLRVDPSQEV